ncbi:MAG: hypothetical protein WC640_03890 [Candidatus Paceibacterota bacterium]|jgi:hypothetical protein
MEQTPKNKLEFASQFLDVDEACPRINRSMAEVESSLSASEQIKLSAEIFDTNGLIVCRIDYDPVTKEIITIYPEPYVNVEETAEHLEEKIYATDEQGNVTDERLSRQEVREMGKRYLIVTSLLFNGGDKILLQKRSTQKKLDPGKMSVSAHGVAKELFLEEQQRLSNGPAAALINTALEINEELRHGLAPFIVRVWRGTHDELFRYAKEKKLNDPNIVWLVPESYLLDSGYSLSDWRQARTRAFSSGYIFSAGEPEISIDPSEVESFKWATAKELFSEPLAADDLPESAIEIIRRMLANSRLEGNYGAKFTENLIRSLMGENIWADKP